MIKRMIKSSTINRANDRKIDFAQLRLILVINSVQFNMGDKSNWLTFRKLRFSIFNLSFYIIFIQRYFSENPTTILEIKKSTLFGWKGDSNLTAKCFNTFVADCRFQSLSTKRFSTELSVVPKPNTNLITLVTFKSSGQSGKPIKYKYKSDANLWGSGFGFTTFFRWKCAEIFLRQPLRPCPH